MASRVNRLHELREERGLLGVAAAAMDARDLYDQGVVCECDEPILVGYALMCQSCLRENTPRSRSGSADASSSGNSR
jgi:hypothetical protein